ncbi:MAG: GNAT family N-acetyltransferase [Candidatus Thorarchaeota archaeon]
MEIIEIKSLQDKELKTFFELPKEVYKNDSIYIAEDIEQIKQRLNFTVDENKPQTWPFIVQDESGPLARVVAISHPKAKDKKGNKIGWLGYFEALKNEFDAVKFLLECCEEKFCNNNIKEIFAPKLDNLYQGLQISNFQFPQTIMTHYNPPYYLDFFKKNDYKIYQRITSVIFTRDNYNAKHYESNDITIRTFNRKDLSHEIDVYHYLSNMVFSGRFDYVNRELFESEQLVKSLLPIIDDDLIIIAEDSENNPVGYLICLPDYNQLKKEGKLDRARIITIGVLTEYQRKNIAGSMGSLLLENLLKKNYQTLEGSIIMKVNIPPQKLAKKFGAIKGREFVLLRKKI